MRVRRAAASAQQAAARAQIQRLALIANGEVVGVAMAGRPVARHFDDGLTLEINRTCTDGSKNANSMLYGACRRAAWALGYRRVITYTQASECGASLRAAGFVSLKLLPARKGWSESSVKLKAIRDPVGNGGVDRVLWEITRGEAEKLMPDFSASDATAVAR